jgi:hypothetical protein
MRTSRKVHPSLSTCRRPSGRNASRGGVVAVDEGAAASSPSSSRPTLQLSSPYRPWTSTEPAADVNKISSVSPGIAASKASMPVAPPLDAARRAEVSHTIRSRTKKSPAVAGLFQVERWRSYAGRSLMRTAAAHPRSGRLEGRRSAQRVSRRPSPARRSRCGPPPARRRARPALASPSGEIHPVEGPPRDPSIEGALLDEAEGGGVEEGVAQVEAQRLARPRVRFRCLPDP